MSVPPFSSPPGMTLGTAQTVTGAKTFNAGALLDKGNQVFDVAAYGAYPDYTTITDGAIASGTAILTSASNPFTASDVGKYVDVFGAGAAGVILKNLTILSYQSAGQVTLSGNASTTVTGAVVDFATNSSTGIQAALAAADSAGGGTVELHAGQYMLRSRLDFTNISNVCLESIAPKAAKFRVFESRQGDGFGFTFLVYGGVASATDITIDGIHFMGNYSGYGTPTANSIGGVAPGVRWLVQNCLFEENGYFPVYLNAQTADSKILWNRFKGAGSNNDRIGGGDGAINIEIAWNTWESDITGNAFNNTGGTYYDIHDNFNYSNNSFFIEAMSHIDVWRNRFYGSGSISSSSDIGYGPASITNSRYIKIWKNELNGGFISVVNAADAVKTSSIGGDIEISGNTIIGSQLYGILVHGSSLDSTRWGSNYLISDNTITDANASAASTSNTGNGVCNPSSINVMQGYDILVANNICNDTRVSPQQRYGIQIGQTLSPTADSEPNRVELTGNRINGYVTAATNRVSATYTSTFVEITDGNTSGTAATLSATLAVNKGGTGVTTSTGTGNIVLSASPTFTGTLTAAAINSGAESHFSNGTFVDPHSGQAYDAKFGTTSGKGIAVKGQSYFGGKVGFTQNTPTAYLHVGAGMSAAGTAPIKIDGGTNLTTPENGAIEFDGTHFYGSIGSTRYQLDQQSGTGGTVTTLSVVTANGLAGTVANATTTPAITLTTSVTGLLKGNGTAISAATAGTDYYNPGGTDVAIADGGTGASTASAGFNALSPMTTAGDIIYGGVSGAGTRLAAGTSSQLLIGGTTPSWGAVTLTTMVTGTLPVANGGTGVTSSTGTGNVVLSASPTFTGTVNAAAITATGAIISTTESHFSSGTFTDPHSGQAYDLKLGGAGKSLAVGGTARFNSTLEYFGSTTYHDGVNLVFETGTGTKLGTATSQKIGAFNAMPVVQPGATTDLGVVLSDLGWRAAGTAWPLTTTGNVNFGNVTLGTAGNKLNITTGSNASAGTGTLVGGTATISTTVVTANSLIFLTDTAASLTNVGVMSVSAKTAGTSFVVTSANVLDVSTFNWLIIN